MEDDTRVCRRCGVVQAIERFERTSQTARLHICKGCRARTKTRGMPKPRPCQRCGATFQPKAYENSRYCTRSCSHLAVAERQGEGRCSPAPWRPCLHCGAEFYRRGQGRYCSDACRKARARADHHRRTGSAVKHAPQVVACVECGEAFTYSRYSKPTIVCSRKCARRRFIRLHPDEYAAMRAKDRAIRRAREEAALTSEMVIPWRVFVRDRWLCWLCGGKVQRGRRHPHPASPTLDHVVPLSLGGDHSYSNVRLAHFICNSRRGNRDATGRSGSLQFALF